MDLTRKKDRPAGFSAASRQDLADKVLEAERGLCELAKEMGISVEALRKWSVMVERAQDTAAGLEDTLVPSSRVRELEKQIEDLKSLLDRQATQIEILKKPNP